jgi:N-acetylneuraminate synthase
MPVRIIAEAGVNHNGDVALARQLVDAAADAGADTVKFQTFKAEQVASRFAQKAAYQSRETGAEESQLDMIRRLELSDAGLASVVAHARQRGIEFLSTPFDFPSLEILTGRFGMRTIKIPSGELTNHRFVLAMARAAGAVILSTGMSTLAEVEAALAVIAFGFTRPPSERPDADAFERALVSAEGQRAVAERVTLLHCTTEYPAPWTEVNLRAMDTMAAAFGLPVGYSDHTTGIHVSLAAVARGARIIEKHFTLDRTLPGPDHKSSLEPSELCDMVRQIREVEASLGDGIKRPTASEWPNRTVARRSLVATTVIEAGEAFSDRNLTCKRPGSGIPASRWYEVLGTKATRRFEPDELIDLNTERTSNG